jgi:hypothetical protein
MSLSPATKERAMDTPTDTPSPAIKAAMTARYLRLWQSYDTGRLVQAYSRPRKGNWWCVG